MLPFTNVLAVIDEELRTAHGANRSPRGDGEQAGYDLGVEQGKQDALRELKWKLEAKAAQWERRVAVASAPAPLSPTPVSAPPPQRSSRPTRTRASVQAGRPPTPHQPMFRCRAPNCGALKFKDQLVEHLVEDHGRVDLGSATAASKEVRAAYEAA